MKAIRLTIGITLVAVAGVVGLVLLAATVVATTSTGARWAIQTMDGLVPATLTVGRVRGSVLAGLRLEDLRYEGEALSVDLAAFEAEVAWPALLRGGFVLDRLELREGVVTLRAPADPPGDASPAGPPALPSIPETLAVRALRVDDLLVQGLATDLRVERLAASLRGPALDVATLELSAAGAELDATAALDVEPSLAAGSIEVNLSLPAEAGTEPQRIGLAGRVELAAAAAPWYVALTWTRLDWEGLSAGRVSSPSGRLVARPGLEPMALELTAQVEAEAWPDAAAVSADATLAGENLDIAQLTVDTLGGEITGRGAADLETLSGSLNLAFNGVDPSRVDERLEGVLRGRVDVLVATEPLLRISTEAELRGELAGHELDGRLVGAYAEQALTVERASVQLGDGRVEVAGTLSPQTADLRFSANVPEIGYWYPPATGTLVASGSVMGEAGDPTVVVEVDGEQLAWEPLPLPPFESLTVRIDGTLQAHSVRVQGQSDLGALSFRLQQGISDERLYGTLVDSALDLARAGTWRLAGPAGYAASAESIALESVCYSGSESARLCLEASEATLSIDADDLPSSLAEPWLPEGMHLEGQSDAELELRWAGPLEGTFTFRQPSLVVRTESPQEDGAASTSSRASDAMGSLTRIADIELAGSLTEQQLHAELGAELAATGDPITGELTLAPPSRDGRLRARLVAALTDLTLVDALVEGVEDLDGTLEAELTVDGSPAAPALEGTLAIRSLDAVLPPLGIAVSDGRLSAKAAGRNDLTFDGTLCSEGCVAFGGRLQLPPEAPWRLTAELEGDGFESADLPDLRAVVSPDLELRAGPEEWRLTGMLELPEASVEVEDVPRTAVQPASETVVHGGRPAAVERDVLPIGVIVDVEARLGDVRFAGRGIEAELDGVLEIERTSQGEWLLDGTTTIAEGRFRAYGQELTIERGQLIFTGPPDNPALDIRATREVEGATVGLMIMGTARNPQSVIFSEPALSESEALARLVTGRSLRNASAADAQALERAAIGLGLRRALPALDRIGESLGLDELSVEAAGETQGAIVAGKQLGEDVYLRYKYGLFDDFAGLELVYRITDRFRLRTETGTAQSIDLVYEVSPGGSEVPIEEVDDERDAGVPADVAGPVAGTDPAG